MTITGLTFCPHCEDHRKIAEAEKLSRREAEWELNQVRAKVELLRTLLANVLPVATAADRYGKISPRGRMAIKSARAFLSQP